MPLISVIIPVYNAEKYLETTINSVINQTIGFENIELILVDDASTDNSKKIIQEYANNYENIIPYYSEENHGFPGFGRNVGLKKSTSKYIMFLDNDDEYDKDICKRLYENLLLENADVVCCDKISVDFLDNTKHGVNYKNEIVKNGNIIIKNDDILLFDNISLWNKIYKKEIITKNNIQFLENTSADDFAFTVPYFIHSNKLVYVKNYYGYYWNIRDSSLSHTVKKEQIYELINTYRYVYHLLKEQNKEKFNNEIIKNHITYILTLCSFLEISDSEFDNILKDIHDFEIEINFSNKLNEKWADITNNLIINKHYRIAKINLKVLKLLRKSITLRKINRIT